MSFADEYTQPHERQAVEQPVDDTDVAARDQVRREKTDERDEHERDQRIPTRDAQPSQSSIVVKMMLQTQIVSANGPTITRPRRKY